MQSVAIHNNHQRHRFLQEKQYRLTAAFRPARLHEPANLPKQTHPKMFQSGQQDTHWGGAFDLCLMVGLEFVFFCIHRCAYAGASRCHCSRLWGLAYMSLTNIWCFVWFLSNQSALAWGTSNMNHFPVTDWQRRYWYIPRLRCTPLGPGTVELHTCNLVAACSCVRWRRSNKGEAKKRSPVRVGYQGFPRVISNRNKSIQ